MNTSMTKSSEVVSELATIAECILHGVWMFADCDLQLISNRFAHGEKHEEKRANFQIF